MLIALSFRRKLSPSLPVFYNFCSIRKKSYGSLDYCMNIVRTLDNENYLCTLLLPAGLRPTAFAIRAFNVEIASVQDQVSKAPLGAMRLKFWDECIDKLFVGKVPNNPVAVELGKAISKHELPKKYLKQLITSRHGRLEQTSFTTLRDMENYAEASCGSVYLLLLHAAGVKSNEVQYAARQIGIAQGLTNLVRGIPHCINNKNLSLPSDLLAQHDVSEEAVFRGQNLERVQDVLRDISFVVDAHLRTARAVENLPDTAKRIFLPALTLDRYFNTLHTAGYDVFDPNTQRKSPFLPFKLYWYALTNRF